MMLPRLSYLSRLAAALLIAGVCLVCLNMTLVDPSLPYRHVSHVTTYVRTTTRDDARVNGSSENTGNSDHVTRTGITVAQTNKTRPVNPHDFKYVINPTTLCYRKNLTYIIYIHSAPLNFKKRQAIRQTWGSSHIHKQYRLKIVFIMGVVGNSSTMQKVGAESARYADIVMEDFEDSYRNLTYKAIAGLRWVSTYCTDVTYVIKSDDDIFIDMHALMAEMQSQKVREYGTTRLIMCNQWLRMKVIRDKNSKWYIAKSEFHEDYFPPYCSGSVFIMSLDVVCAMYEESFNTEFFWVDDYYITGILAQKINLQHRRLNDNYMLNAKVAFQKFQSDKDHILKFFHVHKITDTYRMWETLGGSPYRSIMLHNVLQRL